MKRVYLVYDARACGGDTDRAVVLDTAYTLEEAVRSAKEFAADFIGAAAVYSYRTEGTVLVDQKLEFTC